MTETWAKRWILKVVWLNFYRDNHPYEIEKETRQTRHLVHTRLCFFFVFFENAKYVRY